MSKKEKTDRVEEALSFYKSWSASRANQRKRERDDLACQVPETMWPPEVKAARQSQIVNGVPLPARPMISLDVLSEPVQLVVNQQRSSHLGITIHPLDPDATDDTAEVLQDLVRQIEVDSRAH